VHLAAGASQTVNFALSPRDISIVDDAGVRRVVQGPVEVWVGGGQPVAGPGQLPPKGLSAKFTSFSAAVLPE
jgi:beta-glucosidase